MSKEERESHIKPLTERMMKEPFWLGLLTVFLVMMLISLGYLLRKHLPDKMGKFLQNDQDTGSLEEGNSGLGLTFFIFIMLNYSRLWRYFSKPNVF